jgi:DNA modification methylase
MEYLIRLITPPNGIVLDPFAGSGSTLVAAERGGWKYVGIELDEHYVDIINKRLASVQRTLL